MYLRKIRPRTTCLYSAASMLLRSASAAAQSLASKPRGPPVFWPFVDLEPVAASLDARFRGMVSPPLCEIGAPDLI